MVRWWLDQFAHSTSRNATVARMITEGEEGFNNAVVPDEAAPAHPLPSATP